jgi:hypothetical protein
MRAAGACWSDGTVSTPETTVLLSMLRAQRAHVLGTLTGLPDEALRRPVRPSGWTRLGLVCHLALDVERFWFRAVIAGTPLDAGPAWWPDDPFEDLRRRELRRTVLHVVTETAAHAGHLDAVRELIDGST